MTNSDQDSAHRRSATRAPVGRPIKLQFDDSMDVIEGICRNVSIGGMFIVFENSRPAGSLVRFELEIDRSNAIRGLGEVIWMRSKNDLGGPEPGFGLKFRFLEQKDRQLIFKLVSQHIKERLSRRETVGGEREAPAPPIDRPPFQVAIPPEPEADFEVPEALAEPPEERWLGREEVAVKAAPEAPLAEALLPPVEELPELLPPPVEELPELLPPVEELPESEAELPLFADQLAAVEAPDTSPRVGETFGLDPSVGLTPIYELGLDPEPSRGLSHSFQEPEPQAELPTFTADAGIDSDNELEEVSEPDGREDVTNEPAGRRRHLSLLPVLGLLLVAAAIAFYLYQDEIYSRLGGRQPAVTKVETAPPAVGPEPAPADETTSPEDIRDAVAVDRPVVTEKPPARSRPLPPVDPVPPPSRPPPSPPPPSLAPAGRDFSRLTDISWSPAPGGLKVVLTADGDIPIGRYRHFHLAGDAPRDVVKLMGVRQRFGNDLFSVGGPGVRQIRIGYHRETAGNEIHVVLDLMGPRWRVTEVRNLGPRLELLVGEE